MKKIFIMAILVSFLFVNLGCSLSNRNNPSGPNSNNNTSSSTSTKNNLSNSLSNGNNLGGAISKPSSSTSDVNNLNSSLSIEEDLNDLQKKGLKILENQSFWVEIEKWGRVRFISSKLLIEGAFKLRFYLVDDKGKIIYQFPEFYGNEWPSFDEIRAISFKDANKDGLKDIIIIAEYLSGVGAQGAIPFPVSSIYFQKEKEFINLPELDEQINDANKNENVNMVLKFVEGKIPEFFK